MSSNRSRSDVRRQLFRGLTKIHSSQSQSQQNQNQNQQQPPSVSSSSSSNHIISRYIKKHNISTPNTSASINTTTSSSAASKKHPSHPNPLLRIDDYDNVANLTAQSLILHKPIDYDYKIFSNGHLLRSSKIKAFEQSEKTSMLLFANDESSDDDDNDNILLSIPGYTKEEFKNIMEEKSKGNDTDGDIDIGQDELKALFSSSNPLNRVNKIFGQFINFELTTEEIDKLTKVNESFKKELEALKAEKQDEISAFRNLKDDNGFNDDNYFEILDYLRKVVKDLDDVTVYEKAY